MKPASTLVFAFAAGAALGLACGPVREVGPTALVLEVYFNEARGTKALLISGTAEVDGVPVNVFPTSQRPETLSGAAFPVPQTVRILLNDSRAGLPLQLTVIGLSAEGEPVEAATQVVTPAAQRETLVAMTLRPFTDSVDPDAGVVDGGTDAGSALDAGRLCQCATGCCDPTGACAPARLELGSRDVLPLLVVGAPSQFCTNFCAPGKADAVVNGVCRCGPTAACGDGLRCVGGRCTCDEKSGCRGCCSSPTTCSFGRLRSECGTGGVACARCEPLTNMCAALNRCAQNTCTGGAGTCCSGSGPVMNQWPVCTGVGGECVSCDPLRSNACRRASVDGNANPCACGTSGPCAANQYCLFLNGQPTCSEPRP
jgi:hypothetical protein